jgi:hypothetical protein
MNLRHMGLKERSQMKKTNKTHVLYDFIYMKCPEEAVEKYVKVTGAGSKEG